MNLKLVLRSLGMLLVCESLMLLPPTVISFIYKEGDFPAFLHTILLVLGFGFFMTLIQPAHTHISPKDGFVIVALGWILISLFGALPFYLSGAIPSFVDAFFESCSGFTTTGSTLISDIEALPRGILFWRSFTIWVGGMGILLLTIAILPSMGIGSMQIMKAETPGPIIGKIVPRLGTSAKILYGIYLGLTLLLTILLMLAGMPIYDAFLHAFGTLGTGGFSNKNLSISHYDNLVIDTIITLFMILSGINFSLYYFLIKGNVKNFFKDQELRLYLIIMGSSVLLITWNLLFNNHYDSISSAFRYSSFQIASIMTSTGYTTTDFNLWPAFSKILLLILMILGGCAGSTAGGMKLSRILIGFKSFKYAFKRIIHPHACYVLRFNGKKVEDHIILSVTTYFFGYFVVFLVGILIISLNNFDLTTTLSAVITTLSNVGLGFEMIGPMGNFSCFSDLSKLTLSLLMIIGRVEIYPILLLLVPELWKKN